MITMSTIYDTYAATEEKSGFNSAPEAGYFDQNGDYAFYEQPFEHDDPMLWN